MEKKGILVVDDDEDILESFKVVLQEEGYNVDTSETGREAIERLETQSYNLMLLGIRLPVMNGTELLEIVHERFPEMVKIMITGYPILQNAAESLNHGAAAYIRKPMQPGKALQGCEGESERKSRR